ncbi:MAG: NAD(P)-dependent alcohol dehydrogenase [Clostridiales Family XIII bacterium]|jgi:aryl-alcohol dehydrogenase|nr:NAD(P)-dependent alcohol dehydrogenase [Clostridiales Family XIII bacterium]
MEVKAAVLYERGKEFVLDTVELAEPKQDEVLIKIVASGICHSDEVGRTFDGFSVLPVIMGHEGSGIVEKIGAGVKDLKPGDHVVVTYATCGTCKYCEDDMPTVCTSWTHLNSGGKMRDGTSRFSKDGKEVNNFFGYSSFTSHTVSHVRNVVKIDDDVDLSLMGPLGCGFQTGAGTVLGYLDARPGKSFVVFGCGSVGLSAMMGAKIAGCNPIIAVGGTPDKLNLAKELGATHTINRREVGDIKGEIIKITGGGADYVLDSTGNSEMIRIGIDAMGPLGKTALVGVSDNITIPVMNMMVKNQMVCAVTEGSVNYREFIPKMVAWYKEGRFPIDKLVKFYEFEDIEEAFSDSKSGQTIKPILKMPK